MARRPIIRTILIASFLEDEHVRRIESADVRARVVYRPDLVRPPRYPADHKGGDFVRTPEQEAAWLELLRGADILFDFDQTHLPDLPDVAPNVRWIQSTSSGIGPFVKRMGYVDLMPDTIITRAAGVHAQPLAEFCLMAMLMHSRRHDLMSRNQRSRVWERFAGTDLDSRTVVIVGLGGVGREVARMCAALRMRVIGIGRGPDRERYDAIVLDAYHPIDELDAVLPRADYLVLIVPHTTRTDGLMDRRHLGLLPVGAVLINIGRGALVDEDALIDVLRTGHLGGAALDVFRDEPLPASSPLWDMPNVLISPHSASTSDRENGRITDLFIENLHRFVDGRPMLNVLGAADLDVPEPA
jgi:phosphoglycerate dehydrogenase-like enzyme